MNPRLTCTRKDDGKKYGDMVEASGTRPAVFIDDVIGLYSLLRFRLGLR